MMPMIVSKIKYIHTAYRAIQSISNNKWLTVIVLTVLFLTVPFAKIHKIFLQYLSFCDIFHSIGFRKCVRQRDMWFSWLKEICFGIWRHVIFICEMVSGLSFCFTISRLSSCWGFLTGAALSCVLYKNIYIYIHKLPVAIIWISLWQLFSFIFLGGGASR